MPLSIEDQKRITDFRARVLAGEDVKAEEYREMLGLIRARRVTAAAEGAAKHKKKATAVLDLDALFKPAGG